MLPRDAQRDDSKEAKKKREPLKEKEMKEGEIAMKRWMSIPGIRGAEGIWKEQTSGEKSLRSRNLATMDILSKSSREPIDRDLK
ncbi:hypothetical protein KDK_24970 [Dictyobacter kobayashii]|uniref:Uncharacterized protein n=1 Tax=Dictyobacter kobayashii TaxID=2014872 RepID=A0A402AHW7_9CHLR|nr:hypothetical protein KDK_24970 [Dictyobacter kobayashii]